MALDTATLRLAFAPLVERYMDRQPRCVVCRDWPATTPLVYVADATEADRLRGCVLGLCVVCLIDEHLPIRLHAVLTTGEALPLLARGVCPARVRDN
jgi:hypothetical protein